MSYPETVTLTWKNYRQLKDERDSLIIRRERLREYWDDVRGDAEKIVRLLEAERDVDPLVLMGELVKKMRKLR